jgi:fucose 4-O-acetylase-like acetyltransferase
MPMFILISGILSKKETNFKNIIGSYVIPYIIFDFAYVIFGSLIGQPVSWNVLVPSYVYWYILCIAIMKLMFSKGRAEIALIVSKVELSYYLYIQNGLEVDVGWQVMLLFLFFGLEH